MSAHWVGTVQVAAPAPACNTALKRAFDMVFASILLILAAPVAVLIAAAIALETRGPVFFGHTRIGKNYRRFRVWKFRSMRADADTALLKYLEEHPQRRAEWLQNHKLKHDPRVTRVGRWLRRSSLDELPQLWNVLRGDMSLIGPRPIVEEEIVKYGPALDLYAQALPGLTGLWQVSGRTDISYRRRVALDCEYILNRSLATDVKILFRTVRVVLAGKGAY